MYKYVTIGNEITAKGSTQLVYVTIYGNEKILFNILKNLSARFNDIILQTINEQILNNHQNTCYAIVNFA